MRRIAPIALALICAATFVARAQLAPDIEEAFASKPFLEANPAWCERYNHFIFDYTTGSGMLSVISDTVNDSAECSQYDTPNDYGYNCPRPPGTASTYCTACTYFEGQCSKVDGKTETLQTTADYGGVSDTSRSGTLEWMITSHIRPFPPNNPSHFALFIARHPLCQMNIEAILVPTGSTSNIDPRYYTLSLLVQNGPSGWVPEPAPTPVGDWPGPPSECKTDPIGWFATPGSDDVAGAYLSTYVPYVWVAESSVRPADGALVLNTRVCKNGIGCGPRNATTNMFPDCSAVGPSAGCAYAQLNSEVVSGSTPWYPSKARRYMFGVAHPTVGEAGWASEGTVHMKVTGFAGC